MKALILLMVLTTSVIAQQNEYESREAQNARLNAAEAQILNNVLSYDERRLDRLNKDLTAPIYTRPPKQDNQQFNYMLYKE